MKPGEQISTAEKTVGKTRLPYSTPKLVIHGNVTGITRGSGTGEWTDAAFPARTPISDLTFS